ncbi:hypothetical protein AVEN_234635-1 [Araneus ventricosus]|uniref:Uncharacterized protein n=1 Tax=Araneus ventricosus TaxID=182803 RepID=A0A4Y2D112_ARAVE|nr:hypothetical protein AVEN_234635-1 [Araneus ventricosus]
MDATSPLSRLFTSAQLHAIPVFSSSIKAGHSRSQIHALSLAGEIGEGGRRNKIGVTGIGLTWRGVIVNDQPKELGCIKSSLYKQHHLP